MPDLKPCSENRRSADQRREEIQEFLHQHAKLLQSCGSVVETWRPRDGRRLGPYFQLVYRDQGRQRAVYLGVDPQLARLVRKRLKQLQAPRRQRRQFVRQRSVLRRHLARMRAQWNEELNRVGLRLHGSEVRGWRTASVTFEKP